MMGRYRKRPIEVEAFRFDGTGQAHADADAWAQDLITRGEAFMPPGRPDDGSVFEGDCDGLYINTLEGRMHASAGDWVICGLGGEFYPCKPDIFDATYEEAPR